MMNQVPTQLLFLPYKNIKKKKKDYIQNRTKEDPWKQILSCMLVFHF